MRLPNESPGQTPVPRERGLYSVSHGALLVAASAAVVALVAVYGWLMVLVAGHTGGVTAGLLLVFMSALGVAALSGGAWSVLQHPAIRNRYR